MIQNSKELKKTAVRIADDERIEQRSLLRILAQADPEFDLLAPVDNGAQLVEAQRRQPAEVIIADICMPVQNGLAALREIRRFDENVILLINTAYAEFSYALEAIQIGIDAFLLKPADEATVLGAVRQALKRRQNQRTALVEPAGKLNINSLNEYYEALAQQDTEGMARLATAIHAWFSDQSDPGTLRFAFLNFRLANHQLMKRDPFFAADLDVIENALEQEVLSNCCTDADVRRIVDFYFQRLDYVLQQKAGSHADLVSRLERYLIENYRESIRLDDLAERFFVTGAYLSQLYRQKKGRTISETVRDLRMRETARQLVESDRQIKDIALSNGFSQLPYFYRVFQQYYAMTPSAYRKRYRHGD